MQAYTIAERTNFAWNQLGNSKTEKACNAFLYLSSAALTTAFWSKAQNLSRFPSFSITTQAVAIGSSALLLKAEEYCREKSPKKAILNRYHFVPLLLGLLTATAAANIAMAAQAARAHGLTISSQGFIGQIIAPAFGAATAIFLVTFKAIHSATAPEEFNSELWDSIGETWNDKLKNAAKFSIGTALTLGAAWISSHRTIATAIATGGIASAAYLLNSSCSQDPKYLYTTEQGLSSILVGTFAAGAAISSSFLTRNAINGVAFNSLGHLSSSLLKLATFGGRAF